MEYNSNLQTSSIQFQTDQVKMNILYSVLDVKNIQYDTGNPRIRKALEKHGDDVNAEKINFALRTSDDGDKSGTPSFERLKESIRANKGILSPIVVTKSDGEYVCIDGNTRLAIYRDFRENGMGGSWDKIPCIIQSDDDKYIKDRIRLQAHLVGPREWPAYEKARYLADLRNNEYMSWDDLVAMGGGSAKTIRNAINAYHDMEKHYRDRLESDGDFDMSRFSGFVEFHKNPKIEQAIYEANFGKDDFADWIAVGNKGDRKIEKLADVRKLPHVLRDKHAKSIFLKGKKDSITDASDALRPSSSLSQESIEDASIHDLVKQLSHKLSKMPYREYKSLLDETNSDSMALRDDLRDLGIEISELLNLKSQD